MLGAEGGWPGPDPTAWELLSVPQDSALPPQPPAVRDHTGTLSPWLCPPCHPQPHMGSGDAQPPSAIGVFLGWAGEHHPPSRGWHCPGCLGIVSACACCATGWFLVATSPCCGRRWVPYAGAFIPSADRQPAVWLSSPNCSQCAWTKNCLERWQGLGADDMLGIFPLPRTPPVSSPTSYKNGRQQLGFAGRVGCLPLF